MIYVPFPSLPDSERIDRAAVIDISKVNSLSEALDATGVKNRKSLKTFAISTATNTRC